MNVAARAGHLRIPLGHKRRHQTAFVRDDLYGRLEERRHIGRLQRAIGTDRGFVDAEPVSV